MSTARNFCDALLMLVGGMVFGFGIFIALLSIAADGPAASLQLKLIATGFGILLAFVGAKLFLKGCD